MENNSSFSRSSPSQHLLHTPMPPWPTRGVRVQESVGSEGPKSRMSWTRLDQNPSEPEPARQWSRLNKNQNHSWTATQGEQNLAGTEPKNEKINQGPEAVWDQKCLLPATPYKKSNNNNVNNKRTCSYQSLSHQSSLVHSNKQMVIGCYFYCSP